MFADAYPKFRLATLTLAVPLISAASSITYSVSEIPNGQSYTFVANAVNDQDLVVGVYGGSPAIWDLATNGITVIPAPGGNTPAYGTALAINAQGQVAGEYLDGSGNYQPFVYDPGTGQSTQVTVPNGLQSTGYDISSFNNKGTFVGTNANGQTFTGTASGGLQAIDSNAVAANWINNGGTVVGAGPCSGPVNVGDCPLAMLLPSTPFSSFVGGFTSSSALSINDNGMVIGIASQGGPAISNGFAWEYNLNTSAFTYSSDYFATNPGVPTVVYSGGIDNSGVVVGYSSASGGVICYSGINPDDVLPGEPCTILSDVTPTGWNILDAYQINNQGAILAYGQFLSDADPSLDFAGPVLLEPSGVPEPSTIFGMLTGLAGLLLLRRGSAR